MLFKNRESPKLFLYCHRVSKSYFNASRNSKITYWITSKFILDANGTPKILKVHPGTDLECIPEPTELPGTPGTSPSRSYAQARRILTPKVGQWCAFHPQPPSPITLKKTPLYTPDSIPPSNTDPHAGRPVASSRGRRILVACGHCRRPRRGISYNCWISAMRYDVILKPFERKIVSLNFSEQIFSKHMFCDNCINYIFVVIICLNKHV